MKQPRHNRLVKESSPYLLQHADNPVDWYPWGKEALERAHMEDKPILLSIGYSACHWCHVMEKECFDNEDIAGLMNELFVNIKVDREERPDLDRLYMNAVQMLSGTGGWPLTVFLTPELVPFFGGTYFPPEDRGGMAGFPKVLRSVAEAYRTRKEDIAKNSEQLLSALRSVASTYRGGDSFTEDLIDNAYSAFSQRYDWENGGFGTAPKFPQVSSLGFLLRTAVGQKAQRSMEMVEKALDGMADGGIRDHLGGGFHRYSMDAKWLVPHFEKMLYDNALLARMYLDAYLATGKEEYSKVATETLEYVLGEMTSPRGGFYSSQDADSEGEEGMYYVWDTKEILSVLGEREGRIVARFFGVDEVGNFEGTRSVLHRPVALSALARLYESDVAASGRVIEQGKVSLNKARGKRVRPFRDEKIIASWNGLMIGAMAHGYQILGDDRFLTAARRAAEVLLEESGRQGSLPHLASNGNSKVPGFLEDYSHLCEGLLDLWEADFGLRWLHEARSLAREMIDQFWSEKEQRFSSTGLKHEKLIAEIPALQDDPYPSGNSTAVHVLLRLAVLTGKGDYEKKAEQVLRSFSGLMHESPAAVPHLLSGLHRLLSPAIQIVILSARRNEDAELHLAAARKIHLPNATVVLKPADPRGVKFDESVPLLHGKPALNEATTTYLCVGKTCLAPITDLKELETKLRGLQRDSAKYL